jgi:hypothetical protein
MSIIRLDLGREPRIIISCAANLEIHGSERPETRIETDGDEPEIVAEGDATLIACPSSCSLRLPSSARLKVASVEGDLHIRDMATTTAIGAVGGSIYLRRIHAVEVEQVSGELRAREVASDLVVGTVARNLTLREVAGHVQVASVSGDLLGRDLSGGLQAAMITGNTALRTAVNPDTVWEIAAKGSVSLRLPPQPNIRFNLPPEADLNLPGGVQASHEDGQIVAVLGSGAAVFTIFAAREVILRLGSEYDNDRAFAFSFASGEELKEDLANLTAELDAHFALIESNLADTVSERVKRQVEKRLNIARRQVEAAQRHIEVETARGSDRAGRRFSISLDNTGQCQPVSDAERLLILQMLEDGKISVEQAEELLSALESR